jgi:hypothetical protein
LKPLPEDCTRTLTQVSICIARPRRSHETNWNIAGLSSVLQLILKTEALVEKGMVEMSRLVKAIRGHQERNQARRELNRAIANATTPAMRDELILVAQRGDNVF